MKPYYEEAGITIYHGDAREVLSDLEADSIDLVFTDPPYPKAFDHVWDILADCAPRLMKDGASLLTYCGHYQLPLVLNSLIRTLRYHWLCFQLNASGINPIMHGFKVKVNYKPVLWFTKGPFTRDVIVDDDLGRLGRDWGKQLHAWAQPIAAQPIIKLTDLGGMLLDPFMGSGTMLVAARQLGRHAIGIDYEEACCAIAAERLSQGLLDFDVVREPEQVSWL